MMRHYLLYAALALATLACKPSTERPAPSAGAAVPSATAEGTPPKLEPELKLELVKVVDGDTIDVRRAGKLERLRLLCVDTEERLVPGQKFNPTKPQTVFGSECAEWAQTFFASLGHDGKPVELGLYFPGAVQERDGFGRLLCHVILPDGRDFNLLLVELGKSPYFNKYGNSPVEHAAFLAAQKRAQEQHLGIWDPKTNEPKTSGVPALKRPYAQLRLWWDARARAIDSFQKLVHEGQELVADTQDIPAVLALRTRAAGRELKLFGEVEKLYYEPSGDLTLLMRTNTRDQAIRAHVKSDAREAFKDAQLDLLTHEFQQNYVWIKGQLVGEEHGWGIDVTRPEQIERAGPEPVIPAPAPR